MSATEPDTTDDVKKPATDDVVIEVSKDRTLTIVRNDGRFEGYFSGHIEALVRRRLKDKKDIKSDKIVVDAGPYRMDALSYEFNIWTKTLHLDFYSGLRAGFGSLDWDEVSDIL